MFEKINRDQVLFPRVDSAVCSAARAQLLFQNLSLEVRRGVIQSMRTTSIANAERWACMAVVETVINK
ncbi:MAG: hypothetical protein Q7W05_02200, partial [Deltaproteobacteria bacterium]|nr:hypothetical protein [Deltaproteobacteria bacterium]